MQTEGDRSRIIEIGAPPDRTKVMGNLKFDQTFPPVTQEEKESMARSLGLQGEETLLIAGSTHAGEEEIVTRPFQGTEAGGSKPLSLPCSAPSRSIGRGGEESLKGKGSRG